MITKGMTISEVLSINERYEEVFEKYLLTCAGCLGADTETLEEAAKGHGVNLEELLKDLNGEA
jgi:hybrid cluster-associated redox disulfide protein